MPLLCKKIDLLLEDETQVYKNAKETVAYLQDVITSLEKRAIEEGIPGFKVLEGRKTREITKNGFAYLENILGREKLYEEKPIGITKLERYLSIEDIEALTEKGYITYKIGNPRVVLEGEE